MSKQIYEEALADAKQIRAAAEDHAKRAIMDEIEPRIRELIDQRLMSEAPIDDDDSLILGDKASGGVPMSTGMKHGAGDKYPGGATTMKGGVSDVASANVNAMQPALPYDEKEHAKELEGTEEGCHGEGIYELSLESVEKLMPVFKATNEAVSKEFELKLYKVADKVSSLKRLTAKRRNPSSLIGKINETISNVENMYEYVKETMKSVDDRASLESKLETYFRELTEIRENVMSKSRLNEAGVNFRVTGLPDAAEDALQAALSDPENSENIGIDIEVGDEGGEEGAEEFAPAGEDLAGGDEGGLGDFGGGGDELPPADMGGEEDEEDEGDMTESLSDETVVEIDEAMLRREIKKMKKLHEAGEKKWPSEILSDFGGGKDEGDPWLDGEVTTESEDFSMEEGEEEAVEESEEAVEEGEEEAVEEGEMGTSVPSTPPTTETLKRRIQFEKRNAARISQRLTAIKEAAKKTSKGPKMTQLREAWNTACERLATSKSHVAKYESLLKAEASKASKKASKNAQPSGLTESTEVKELRNRLAAQNLHNAKLSCANKLLQAEGLSPKQKVQIIKSLDEAHSLREVKLLYENLSKAMGSTKSQINEGGSRPAAGSSSRVAKPGATPLNESAGDVERWARLAGINK